MITHQCSAIFMPTSAGAEKFYYIVLKSAIIYGVGSGSPENSLFVLAKKIFSVFFPKSGAQSNKLFLQLNYRDLKITFIENIFPIHTCAVAT